MKDLYVYRTNNQDEINNILDSMSNLDQRNNREFIANLLNIPVDNVCRSIFDFYTREENYKEFFWDFTEANAVDEFYKADSEAYMESINA